MAIKNEYNLDTQRKLLLHSPAEWQEAAWTQNALIYRRAVASAEALLPLSLAYAWNDWSLRTTAAWAGLIGLADLSDVAVLKRLQHARG